MTETIVKKTPDVEEIHRILRQTSTGLEDVLMKVIFEQRSMVSPGEDVDKQLPAYWRNQGHERRADRPLALAMVNYVNDALFQLLDLRWDVRHVNADEIPSTTREHYYTANAFGYPLPGHGNTTRAIAPYEGRYFRWDDPDLPKQLIARNAAILIGVDYPVEFASAKGKSSMVSVLKLHNGEILSALRKQPNESSVGFRGGKEPVWLDPADYRVDKNKTTRIILPNYLGSVANEEHLGVFRRQVRQYSQLFGPEGFDVSFDGAEWNTACDIGNAMIVRHQASAYVDVRYLTPNINPDRDATLIVSDIKVPAHIAETVNFFIGTTNAEPIHQFHDISNLNEGLDAMLLVDDLINGELGFDFRECILEGRLAYLRSFYEGECGSVGISDEVELENGYYRIASAKPSEEATEHNLTKEDMNLMTYQQLNNHALTLIAQAKDEEALAVLKEAKEKVGQEIKDEMKKNAKDVRTDYTDIIQLRKKASAIYGNMANLYLRLHEREPTGAKPERETHDDHDDDETKMHSETKKISSDNPSLLENANHFADLAVLYNPHDFNLLHKLGRIHEHYDETLLGVDSLSAKRRARIYYKYALAQLNSETKKGDSTDSSGEFGRRKADLLDSYISIMESIYASNRHDILKKELDAITAQRRDLNLHSYEELENAAKRHGLNHDSIKTAIESCPTDSTSKAEMIEHAITFMDKLGKGRERAIGVWATTHIHDHILTGLIGDGAYGVVFQASHEPTSEMRAAKVIDLIPRVRQHLASRRSEIADMVKQEYENAKAQYDEHSRVIAPYVVRIIDVTRDERSDRYAIIQELLKGDFTSLAQKTWTDKDRGEYAKQFTLWLCEALEAIHGIDFYHRDLSPANILYYQKDEKHRTKRGEKERNKKTGRVYGYKLGDFGLSQTAGRVNELTLSIAAAYIRDPHPEEPAMADLYAAGSNIILAYTGQQPYVSGNPRPTDPNDMEKRIEWEDSLNIAKEKMAGIKELCSTMPEGIREISMKLMQPDPDKREYTDAASLNKAVQQAYAD